VLTHASFRLKHVLSDGESMHVIDSDNALRTDPLFDVAQFVTSLHDTEAQGILPAGCAAELEAAFLEGYALESGRPVPEPALHWYAACLLLERRCWKHLKHLSPNAVPMIRRLLGLALRRIEMFHAEE
jgi:aminoglycoside phosphotransferase (APT) family kinase protein